MTETGQTGPDEDGVVMDVTHARQARRGKHVLWILIISLVLGAAALFIPWLARAPQLEAAQEQGESRVQATPSQAPEPAARQNTQSERPPSQN